VMAHKNASTQEGNRLVIHDEGSVMKFPIKLNAGKVIPGTFPLLSPNGPGCGFYL
jgi:hypothetical protein